MTFYETPFTCHIPLSWFQVGPGEVLYLPSKWHQYVEQRVSGCSGGKGQQGQDYVMALNFWYDMKFDSRWAYYKLVEQMGENLGLSKT